MVRSVAGEGEILTIAVQPEYRQRGFGAQLLDATLAWFEKSAAGAIFLEVACGNKAAIALYRRFGFCEIGRRKGYTIGQCGAKQDALRMGLDLDQGHPECASG
jgi:[ribosomal protein S18]-alanine N-acetyltransferase